MDQNFCKNLSNGAFIQQQGHKLYYKPCCWVPLKSELNPIISNDSRKKIESVILRQKESYCKECINREVDKYNPISHRLSANRIVPENAIYGNIYTLTVQVDTTCNAACVMCGPSLSSLWRKQIDPQANLEDFSDLYKSFLENTDFSHIRRVLFLGGEPLLSDLNLKILEAIPDPSKVVIAYTTNGSLVPQQDLLDLWSRFKKLELSVSIDGTEDQFEYIRWPLPWGKVSENLKYFHNLMESRSNWDIRINMTVNPLNLYYYDQLESWVKGNIPMIPLRASKCYGDWGLDATPIELRQWAEQRYSSDHVLVKMLKSCDLVEGKFQKILELAHGLDQKRKTDYRSVFSSVLSLSNF
jgi:sulfatase maturation enzyme AslB (radical SAM superfamily)